MKPLSAGLCSLVLLSPLPSVQAQTAAVAARTAKPFGYDAIRKLRSPARCRVYSSNRRRE
jgi:hypothetical protein